MANIKSIKNSDEVCFEDSIFNHKLFLNLNINSDILNKSSYTKELDNSNSNEVEDNNESFFLTKELIEELNSSKLDIPFNSSLKKDEITQNKINSFFHIDRDRQDNLIQKIYFNEIFLNNNRFERFNKYNFKNYIRNKNTSSNNKKNKIIKEKMKDWVCPLCNNLNYSFRIICNRCKMSKKNMSKL